MSWLKIPQFSVFMTPLVDLFVLGIALRKSNTKSAGRPGLLSLTSLEALIANILTCLQTDMWPEIEIFRQTLLLLLLWIEYLSPLLTIITELGLEWSSKIIHFLLFGFLLNWDFDVKNRSNLYPDPKTKHEKNIAKHK